MRSAARIWSRFAVGMRKHVTRRPLSMAGFFVAVAVLGIACNDQQLPTDVKKAPSIVRHNASVGDGPVISTDKADYAVGETAVIEGWAWTSGEVVRLQVVHVDESGNNELPQHQPWDVTADADGNVSSTWQIAIDADEAGATLKLTADGQTSGAHAEVLFSDLVGTVNLFSDAGYTIAQTAFAWNSSVYPRILTPQANTCYRIQWTDPSSDVFNGFAETGFPAPATLDLPSRNVGEESGSWNVVVAQRPAGSCSSQTSFSQATNPIYFDVARTVVIGAGTSGSDAVTGGDNCVYLGGAPPGGDCSTAGGTGLLMTVRNTANYARAFLRFDMPALDPGVVVTSAKVRLTTGSLNTRQYSMQRANAAWNEASVTAPGPAVTGTIVTVPMATSDVPGNGGGSPQTRVYWTVTSHVAGFLDASYTNYGWRISDSDESNGSATSGRFHTTEQTSGCYAGVTTCKRSWPVLLIDYVDPPKLAFITSPFTGEVGQCLGPMRVQSRDFSGSPLVVTSNLTVNLSTDNLGTGGAGSFFSNASCTTGTTTTTIQTDSTNSNRFYYRATGRGDGTHDVIASATGYTPDASQTETINKATTYLTYTGDRILLVGNNWNYSAILTSAWEPCTENKRIIFRLMPSPLNNSDLFYDPAPDTTDLNGVVGKSVATTNWIEGIYDGRTNFTGDANCEASKDEFAMSALLPGGAATGGGFLAGSKIGGGRANFGFTIRPINGSDPIAYKGQFLMIRQDGNVPQFRCKGNITQYGSIVPATTPASYAASGTCDFQLWDPALDGGLGDWYVPAGPGYAGQTFTIYFIDNGSGKGKTAPPPDEFGFTIGAVGGYNPSFAMAPINGGNIDVKGTTTTTSTGGSGGGKKK